MPDQTKLNWVWQKIINTWRLCRRLGWNCVAPRHNLIACLWQNQFPICKVVTCDCKQWPWVLICFIYDCTCVYRLYFVHNIIRFFTIYWTKNESCYPWTVFSTYTFNDSTNWQWQCGCKPHCWSGSDASCAILQICWFWWINWFLLSAQQFQYGVLQLVHGGSTCRSKRRVA